MSRASCPNPRDVETLFRLGAIGGLEDGPLLDRFIAGGDAAGAAFEAIVGRHGPMVLGVCRRVAGDEQIAEDAFQAAFLVLALRARAIRRRESLGPWLHGVASRVARRARETAARRRRFEISGTPPEVVKSEAVESEAEADELRRVLDDELGRLPGKYRDPLVLCYLEGRSQEEAARVLGWTKGTVSGRLARAKDLLRSRLVRRGVAPAATLATSLVLPGTSPAAVPTSLVTTAARNALAATIGCAEAAGASATVLEQARRVIWTMSAVRWSTIAASLTLILLTSAGAWSLAARETDPAPATPVKAPSPVPAMNPVLDDPLPRGATLRFGSSRFRHPTTIESLAVSADGKLAAATSGTQIHGVFRAYDLTTGQMLPDFQPELGDIVAVALSPDGKTLAATSYAVTSNPGIYLFDMTSGEQKARIPYPPANPGSNSDLLLFEPDGTHVLVKTADGKGLHRIELAKGEIVRTYPANGIVFAAALSPDGKRLVAAGYDYEQGGEFSHIWKVDTGLDLGPLPNDQGTIRCLEFSPDSATIAAGVDRRHPLVKLFHAGTGQERLTIPLPDASSVRSLAFSPDGHTLAASGGSFTRLFDAANGEQRRQIDRQAIGLRFSPDGKTLAGAVGGVIERWDVSSGESLIPQGGDSPVAQIALTPDGQRLITLGQEGDGHIWDARTGKHQLRLKMGWQRGFALSPDGRFLVWPERDESIEFPDDVMRGVTRNGTLLRLFDLSAGAFVDRFAGFEGDVHDLYFIDGGKTLITLEHYRHDANVRLWNVSTGQVARSFPAPADPESRTWSSRLSPDGKILSVTYQGMPLHGLVARGNPAPVKLWDIATGQRLDQPLPSWSRPDVLSFSPDGTTFAAATPDGKTLQFRDTSTGRLLHEFPVPSDRVTSLSLGPDGLLFTGTQDATVLAWDSRVAKPQPPGKD